MSLKISFLTAAGGLGIGGGVVVLENNDED